MPSTMRGFTERKRIETPMSLTVAKAAELTGVTERTVVNWIRKDGLPACKVNDQYQLNRVELLEWATNHGIKLSPAIFSVEDAEEESLPSLSTALETGGIHFGIGGDDQQSVLKHVVDLLPLPPQVDRDFMLQVLMAREALGTTAMGDGIAIPHVRNPILVQLPVPKIALCFLSKPIDFGALDNKPVQILFTIISPTIRMHLHLLSKLAYCLRDQRLRGILGKQCNSEEIMAVVLEIEKDIGRAAS